MDAEEEEEKGQLLNTEDDIMESRRNTKFRCRIPGIKNGNPLLDIVVVADKKARDKLYCVHKSWIDLLEGLIYTPTPVGRKLDEAEFVKYLITSASPRTLKTVPWTIKRAGKSNSAPVSIKWNAFMIKGLYADFGINEYDLANEWINTHAVTAEDDETIVSSITKERPRNRKPSSKFLSTCDNNPVKNPDKKLPENRREATSEGSTLSDTPIPATTPLSHALLNTSTSISASSLDYQPNMNKDDLVNPNIFEDRQRRVLFEEQHHRTVDSANHTITIHEEGETVFEEEGRISTEGGEENKSVTSLFLNSKGRASSLEYDLRNQLIAMNVNWEKMSKAMSDLSSNYINLNSKYSTLCTEVSTLKEFLHSIISFPENSIPGPLSSSLTQSPKPSSTTTTVQIQNRIYQSPILVNMKRKLKLPMRNREEFLELDRKLTLHCKEYDEAVLEEFKTFLYNFEPRIDGRERAVYSLLSMIIRRPMKSESTGAEFKDDFYIEWLATTTIYSLLEGVLRSWGSIMMPTYGDPAKWNIRAHASRVHYIVQKWLKTTRQTVKRRLTYDNTRTDGKGKRNKIQEKQDVGANNDGLVTELTIPNNTESKELSLLFDKTRNNFIPGSSSTELMANDGLRDESLIALNSAITYSTSIE